MHASASHASPDQGCSTFLAALDAVVDGEADALSVARVEAHAQGCARCAGRLASARARRDRLRRIGAGTAAPDSLRARVAQILQAVRGSRTR